MMMDLGADEAPVTRSVGADLAAAFVRGSVEFACFASLIVPFVALFARNAGGGELLGGWAGLVLGGAVFAMGSAAWRHARTGPGKRLVLLLSSLVAAMSVVLPLALTQEGPGSSILGAFGFAIGLALGVGQALAGVPFSKVSFRDGALSLREAAPRAIMVVSYTSLLVLVPFACAFLALLGAPVHSLANVSSLVLYVFPILTLLRSALAPLAEDATRAALAKKPVTSSHSVAVEEWRRSLSLANVTTDPGARVAHLEHALENARIAYALSLAETAHLDLSQDRRRYVELIFLLGKTDEIEAALARFCEGPGLVAELARLRGEPERAVELAGRALASTDTNATDRANALSVLALAEAELGRFAQARERLEALARAQRMVKPLVPRFRASSIAVEIGKFESGERKSSARRTASGTTNGA